MNDQPIVCYLYTSFDQIDSIENFKYHYKKHISGYNHKLIICFKLLNKLQITKIINMIKDLKFEIFIDDIEENDFDFGSYKRVSEKYINRDIFFLNSHSYPICDNWLKSLMKYKEKNNLIGASGSYESMLTSINFKKKYKILSYLFRLYKFRKSFPNFPNPHLRTSCFLINSEIFLDYMINKKIKSKFDAWKIESGFNSLTNYFKSKNYNIFVVNSKGEKFLEKEWKISNTYCYLDQENLIISDKHTRNYQLKSLEKKIESSINVWG